MNVVSGTTINPRRKKGHRSLGDTHLRCGSLLGSVGSRRHLTFGAGRMVGLIFGTARSSNAKESTTWRPNVGGHVDSINPTVETKSLCDLGFD